MRRRAGLFVVALFIMTSFMFANCQAQDPIQILDIDTYERTIAPGEQTTFNWTVRNIDPMTYNITITPSSAPDWTVEAIPTQILYLDQNRAAKVSVNVTAPGQISSEVTVDVKVLFTVYQDGAIVFVGSRIATVHIPSIYAEKLILGFFSNPLPAPLDNEWGVFLLDVLAWLLIAILILLIVIPSVKEVGKLTKSDIDDKIIRIVRTPLVTLLFFYGTIQSLETLDQHIDLWIRDLLRSIYNIVLTVMLIYVGYKLFKEIVIHIGKTISKKTVTHLDDILVPLVEKIGLVVIGFIGLGILLGYLNVDLSMFVAGGVVVSMVIAFAAQDTISNFFSGIFLLTDRPFAEGDIIIMDDGDWVEVRRIGMRTTRLFRFKDASIVTLPNNRLVNDKIANFSNPKDMGRIMKTFNVAYGSDPAQVKKIIKEVIDENPNILKEDPHMPVIRFDAMGESSLDFFILIWVDDRKNRFAVQDYLNTEIYNRFNAAGIDIPFPQRTVHLRMEGGEVDKSKLVPPDIDKITAQDVARRDKDLGDATEAEGGDEGDVGGA